MTIEEKYKLSSYKDISVFSESSSKKIYIVMDEPSCFLRWNGAA